MSKRLTTEEYIIKVKATHGDRYDYSELVYVDCDTKVRVLCKIHGAFQQWPSDHRRGFGCPHCSGKARHTTKSFIELAKGVHGDLYDYSLVNYKSMNTKVPILCKKHGIFITNPNWHIYGTQIGCPVCNTSKGEIHVEKSLNEIKITFIKQKVFKGCIGRFDFYLPKYNLCIEFDGAQHFAEKHQISKDPLKRKALFKDVKRRDKVKNLFCKINGIDLLRINYTQYKNIDFIIKEKINSYGNLCNSSK